MTKYNTPWPTTKSVSIDGANHMMSEIEPRVWKLELNCKGEGEYGDWVSTESNVLQYLMLKYFKAGLRDIHIKTSVMFEEFGG